MNEEANKRHILALVRQWRSCTGLTIEQLLKLMQEDKDLGVHRVKEKITRAWFENKFIHKPDNETRYYMYEIYALLAAFTKGAILKQCCLAEEAVNLCIWARIPIDRQRLDMLFGQQAVETALNKLFRGAALPQKHWKLTGNLAGARNLHGMCLLDDGRVLTAGGRDSERSGEPLAATELYMPNRGTWSNVASMNVPRFWLNMVRLKTGKVLAVGGTQDPEGEGYASAELYDPMTGQWAFTGSMQYTRRQAACILLPDGRVMVAGGAHGLPDRHRYRNTVEIYDPITGRWSPVGNLNIARDNANVVQMQDGRILLIGGESAEDSVKTTEMYKPETGTWEVAAQLSFGRSSCSATLLRDGRVVVAGGATHGDRDKHDTVDIYDPQTNTWKLAAPMHTKRYLHGAILLSDNRVLITGGLNAMGFLRSTEIYDPETDTWVMGEEMQIGRVGHQIVTLPNGNILVVGGLSDTPSNSTTCELYG